MKTKAPFYDVVIVGAGLSGIAAAHHLKDKCPDKKFVVLEARSAMGGTWDLFKYPGLRSDSDMYTLGFSFNPWKNPKAIADGPSILQYIKDTSRDFGIDQHIHYNHKVTKASWSDETSSWMLDVDQKTTIECSFLFMCSGYYDYDAGHRPSFPNEDSFAGPIIHPQKWDTDLDYQDKEVVVIGSGATAITIVPEMAKKAKKVTMLQRSPGYIMNLPSEDKLSNFLAKILPSKWAHGISRWKNILVGMLFYNISRVWPKTVKKLLKGLVAKQLGESYEDKHFDPKYNPWDQRLCLVPDNDFFDAIKDDRVAIVTNTIKSFTPSGIVLDDGSSLDADIIVTATGLKLRLFGGMQIVINGEVADTARTHAYRGVMFSDVPNFAVAIGYTNASWTLKCDLNCHFVTRLLNHMSANKLKVCTPRFDTDEFSSEPLLDFNAGYVTRALSILPKQGSSAPWKVYQNYIKDWFSLKYGSVKDRYLDYQK